MKDEDWKIIEEHQRIRNLHEAEYFKELAELRRTEVMIFKQQVIDVVVFTFFWLYICFSLFE
ncbi:hypothetical protein [Flavobacterium gelatinilyticum]|uniref:hypothetical protein n=1 Tax=Flavobacterium gelatinilyticum TaxID=3003260 RepID=UPI0024806A5D|nr:hypothetical protein [Flavobacterium gelatinilyticum]